MDVKSSGSANFDIQSNFPMDYNFSLSQGEQVANYILEKLISFTITESEKKEMEKNMGNHCFNFIKVMLNQMVMMSNIAFDREDYKIEVNDQKKKDLFYDNIYYGANDWKGICEPRKNKIDRSATTNIRILKGLLPKSNLNISGDDVVSKISGSLNGKSLKDIKNPLKESDNKILTEIKRKKSGISMKSLNNSVSTKKEKDMNKTNTSKEENYIFLNFKLDNIKEFYEDPEIKLVREEREREWKRIEDEKIKKANLDIIMAEIQRNEQRLKSKEVDGKKITFDSDGGVINIKNVITEKLKDEFVLAKTEIKEKFEILSLLPNAITKIGKIDKEKKDPKETKDAHEKHEELLKKKGANRSNAGESRKSMSKAGAYKLESAGGQQVEKCIQPAGSNFEMFWPETGVVLQEEGKEKKGDRDYFKKYNKYSKYDYISLLRESVKTITEKPKKIKLDNISDINQNISLGATLPTLSNRNGEMMKKSNMINSRFMNNTIISNTIEEGIRLSNKETINLQTTMNSLELIPELDEKLNAEPGISQKKTFMDIFGKKRIDQIKMKNLEEINKFNLSIINNAKWGEDSKNSGKVELGNRSVNKPTLKELEKTIGFQMAHSKLPRQRIANSNARSFYKDFTNTK